jgi:hypothetical protein
MNFFERAASFSETVCGLAVFALLMVDRFALNELFLPRVDFLRCRKNAAHKRLGAQEGAGTTGATLTPALHSLAQQQHTQPMHQQMHQTQHTTKINAPISRSTYAGSRCRGRCCCIRLPCCLLCRSTPPCWRLPADGKNKKGREVMQV